MSTTPDKAVTDEVVEAAARGLCRHRWDDMGNRTAWDHVINDAERDWYRAAARAVLSAALPYLHQTEDTDLVAALRQRDTELEEWRTGVRRLPTEDTQTAGRTLPALDEFEGFFIANDDGYPELRYSDSDDGNDEGDFVKHVDAGTSLPGIVRAAREHTASLRAVSTGDQSEPTTPARQT